MEKGYQSHDPPFGVARLRKRHAIQQDNDNDDAADLVEITRKHARKYGPALSPETVALENHTESPPKVVRDRAAGKKAMPLNYDE